MKTLQEDIASIISELANVEPVDLSPQTYLADIGLDSLGLMALAAHLDSYRGIKCSEEEAMELSKAIQINDIVNWAIAVNSRQISRPV